MQWCYRELERKRKGVAVVVVSQSCCYGRISKLPCGHIWKPRNATGLPTLDLDIWNFPKLMHKKQIHLTNLFTCNHCNVIICIGFHLPQGISHHPWLWRFFLGPNWSLSLLHRRLFYLLHWHLNLFSKSSPSMSSLCNWCCVEVSTFVEFLILNKAGVGKMRPSGMLI